MAQFDKLKHLLNITSVCLDRFVCRNLFDLVIREGNRQVSSYDSVDFTIIIDASNESGYTNYCFINSITGQFLRRYGCNNKLGESLS